MSIPPTSINEDRGHGYRIVVQHHKREWDVEGPGAALLRHDLPDGSYHYDLLQFGGAEEQIRQGADLLLAIISHPSYEEIHLLVARVLEDQFNSFFIEGRG